MPKLRLSELRSKALPILISSFSGSPIFMYEHMVLHISPVCGSEEGSNPIEYK
jgi:hypothetical protein